jgi:hypothetical protein
MLSTMSDAIWRCVGSHHFPLQRSKNDEKHNSRTHKTGSRLKDFSSVSVVTSVLSGWMGYSWDTQLQVPRERLTRLPASSLCFTKPHPLQNGGFWLFCSAVIWGSKWNNENSKISLKCEELLNIKITFLLPGFYCCQKSKSKSHCDWRSVSQ